jgi:hypothetical protein
MRGGRNGDPQRQSLGAGGSHPPKCSSQARRKFHVFLPARGATITRRVDLGPSHLWRLIDAQAKGVACGVEHDPELLRCSVFWLGLRDPSPD